ncbi:MAG: hypothetical protein QF864_00385 [SAR202 cluster bacterium]|jgi:hypothetical protein|nr:hypothetical protein [SAR202 cluster bacterium]|tara:strand:- start:112 stop:867 length:756 start_codon:yes stop_codon:yes gene_type:complete
MIDETKIMQLADGTLPQEEHEEVKKAIAADPKLKELYNTYQETGDILFKLGNEIKSQPLPKNLQEKAEILKSWKKPIKQESGSFNFFGLFKMQYAGIAVAFCLFFVGGYYTKTFMASIDPGKTRTVEMAKEKVEVHEKLKTRSLPNEKEDLQTRIQSLYLYFDQENFLSEISHVIDELQVNGIFESSLKDNDGKKVKFVLVENFNFNKNSCKKFRFNEPLRLSNIDEGTKVTLDLCKINESYELSSINISK